MEDHKRGYAIDDEENTAGRMCVALPLEVGDPREEPLHAASTTMLKARVTHQLIENAVTDLAVLVSHLSTRAFLGGSDPRLTASALVFARVSWVRASSEMGTGWEHPCRARAIPPRPHRSR